MYPVINFSIFGYPLTLHSSGIFYALAFLTGILIWYWLTKKTKLEYQKVLDYIFGVIILGVIGARLFYILEFKDEFGNLGEMVAVWNGGLVFYGGFIFASIYLVTHLYFNQRDKIWRWLDTAIMATLVGHAVGRISCFLNGDSFGKPSNLPWAIKLPALGDNISRHPTPIYELIAYLLIFLILLSLFKKQRRDGEILFIGIILYSLARFLIEFLRYHDVGELLVNNFSYSQLISLILLSTGIAGIFYIRKIKNEIKK
jgi:phosphatidylglycerol:prolipoprotein diacylglycerol transferase